MTYDPSKIINDAKIRRKEILSQHRSGRSQKEIALEFGVSQSRVSAIIIRAKKDEIPLHKKISKMFGVDKCDEDEIAWVDNLSIRAVNILLNWSSIELSSVRKMSIDDLMKLPNCGRVTALEIANAARGATAEIDP